MYIALNTLSVYAYFYISKNITSYTFLLTFKTVESLQCILKKYPTFNSLLPFLFIQKLFTTQYLKINP